MLHRPDPPLLALACNIFEIRHCLNAGVSNSLKHKVWSVFTEQLSADLTVCLLMMEISEGERYQGFIKAQQVFVHWHKTSHFTL